MFGGNSIEFKNTAVASTRIDSDFIPVAAGRPHLLTAWWYSTGTPQVQIGATYYDKDETNVGGAFAGKVLTASTWTEVRFIATPGSTAAYVKLYAIRPTASTSAFCGYLGFEQHAPMFRAEGTLQAVSTGTWTKVTLDAEDFDYGSNFDRLTNYRFVAPYDLVMAFSGAVTLTSVTGDAAVALYKNGAVAAYGSRVYANNHDVIPVVSTILELAPGDYVEMYVQHNHGSSRNTVSGSEDTYLSGHEIK
jgi:hypothetical protein